jgi:hypothetical protein
MRWSWNVTTDKPHIVEADISPVSSRETVAVNGVVVSNAHSMKFRNRHEVPLGPGSSGTVEISSTWYGFPRCRLVVDGLEIPPSHGASPGSSAPRELPRWSWIFFVLCGAIPVITLGGVIPVLIGVGGIAACGAGLIASFIAFAALKEAASG